MTTRRTAAAACALAVVLLFALLYSSRSAPPAEPPPPNEGASSEAVPAGLPDPAADGPRQPAEPVAAEAAAERPRPRKRKTPVVWLTGTILDADGWPAKGVSVYHGGALYARRLLQGLATSDNEIVVPSASIGPRLVDDGLVTYLNRDPGSDEEGRFRQKAPFEPGTFDLLIVRHTKRDRTSLAEVRHVVRGIEYRKGEIVDLGTIRLPAPGRLRGRVVDADGAPLADARVWCVPTDLGAPIYGQGQALLRIPAAGPSYPGPEPVSTTGAFGGFELENLRPAPYLVFARTADAFGVPVRVRVGADEDTTLEIVVDHGGGWIAGRLVDPGSGEPRSGVVWALGGGGAKVDEDGAFRIGPLWPGEYLLRVIVEHDGVHTVVSPGPSVSVREGEVTGGVEIRFRGVR